MPTLRKWQPEIKCHTCNHTIKHGEKYTKTLNPYKAYCNTCSNKEVLVYQPKRRHHTYYQKT